jgi:hypothetical protein
VKNGANMPNVESPLNQSRENNGSAAAVNRAHGSSDATSQEALHQLSDLLSQFRNMQRRQIDFIRKRFPLLENCLNDEYCQKEYSVSAFIFHVTHNLFNTLFISLWNRQDLSLKR